jgi:Right handed beta helix region
MRGLFGLLLLLSSTLISGSLALGGELVIYLHPQGSDSADGLSQETSVASLQEAVRIAEEVSGKEAFSIRIAVAPGEYKGQSAKSRGHSSVNTIKVTSADPSKPRPRFDGDGKGGTWFDLRSASERSTHYTIEGLEIINFETAINLAGDRNRTELSNSGNQIRNNVFINIGQTSAESPPSTAVIRLVNSDDNVIKDNRFIHIKNRERCSLLHSIYVAHDSTNNVIEGNIFEDLCGDAIRFRDGSNANLIKDNVFIDAWDKAPVSDWYCDRDRRDDCTKATGECPSMNNVLMSNTVFAKILKPVKIFLAYGNDIYRSCPTYPEDVRFLIRS